MLSHKHRLIRKFPCKANWLKLRSGIVQNRVCSKKAASPKGSKIAINRIASAEAGEVPAIIGEFEKIDPIRYRTKVSKPPKYTLKELRPSQATQAVRLRHKIILGNAKTSNGQKYEIRVKLPRSEAG